MKFLVALLISVTGHVGFAQDYALDDAHNHDGTHVEGQTDCGSNYMFPGDIARLGSHSFLILGEDGPDHLLLDHRSGTPPHTYQFILRVRVDANEMAIYRKLLKETKVALPAVTTIFFDKTGKQVDRTFFCLPDLKKIFGPEQKPNDAYSKLFPIRASWQKDADFEGAFPIKQTVAPEDPLILERKDVEIVLYRYLPSYLEQSSFRKMLKTRGSQFTSILSHAPIRADEPAESAAKRSSYIKSGAFESNGETCQSDYYLKSVRPPKTKHGFLLLAENGKNSVLAVHLYDQSPQNYQTTLNFELTDEQMKVFRQARQESKTPLLFMPTQYFCMAELKDLVKRQALNLKGTIYRNSEYEGFRLGQPSGELDLASSKVKVLVNRILQSLMNPQSVARDVFGVVDLRSVNADIFIEAAYSRDWNFIGKPVDGYLANRCYLTSKAAKALSEVQKEVSKLGYSLLVFDCYRPQRAVNQFVSWTKDASDSKMQSIFYPDEPKKDLIKRGYIDAKSGHSRASTVDLTLVRTGKFQSKDFYQKAKVVSDCRKSQKVGDTGQVDMGTAFDCFSELAHTTNPSIPEESQKHRQILKAAMEKQGFTNYPKEWWHFVLKDEPYKSDYFDFEVQ
ncbi:MAG: M15 family metallopeptidase [Bdellovibrionaceae bacterium]|nr:M15 family metallopeptidase [Pseudobdellovibrionaceae bacterium]